MTDLALDTGQQATEPGPVRIEKRGWVYWTIAGLCALAILPGAVLFVLHGSAVAAPPLQLTAAFAGAALAVAGGIALAALVKKPAKAWLVCLASVAFLCSAAALTHIPGGEPFPDLLTFGVHVVALAPSCAAVWAWTSRIDRLRERAVRSAVAAVSAVAVVQVLTVCALAEAAKWIPALSYSDPLLVLLFVVVSLLPFSAALILARVEKRLPINFSTDAPYGHITSLGVLTLAAFVGVIAALGAWSASRGASAEINQDTGLATVMGLAVAFAGVGVIPTSRTASSALEAITRAIESNLGALSKFFSWLDGVLVLAIAPLLGATQPKRSRRYGLLFGHLFACAWLGWVLPPPAGLVPLAWAFIAVLAIARRWAWVEEDRENAMLNRKFSGDHIRIGFSNDLRDETLLGFMTLFLIVPFVLRQLHLADGERMFILADGVTPHNVLAWVSFFGTELAKAVPFVDWAEIYQVEGSALIRMDEAHIGDAQHAVFAMRVLVDLVFLAALLQALSSLQRSAKLRDMFYKDRTLDRLDPFAEAAAFRALATPDGEGWRLIDNVPDPFWSYDEDRLEELADREDDAAISFVAKQIIERNSERPLEQLLIDEARQQAPDGARLETLIGRMRDERPDPDISLLKLAHFHLNNSGKAWSIRAQIVQIIADNWRKPGAVQALCDILMLGGAKDGRAEVRLIALQALHQAAQLEGDRNAQAAIRYVATQANETARITAAAQLMINQNPSWGT